MSQLYCLHAVSKQLVNNMKNAALYSATIMCILYSSNSDKKQSLLVRGPWSFYLGHVKKFIYNTIQYNTNVLKAAIEKDDFCSNTF